MMTGSWMLVDPFTSQQASGLLLPTTMVWFDEADVQVTFGNVSNARASAWASVIRLPSYNKPRGYAAGAVCSATVNTQSAEPLEMSMENRSYSATVRGVLVKFVNW